MRAPSEKYSVLNVAIKRKPKTRQSTGSLNSQTNKRKPNFQTSLEKAKREELDEVDDFLSPRVDVEKSMKFKSIRYKKSPGPKQDWNCNFI